MKKLTILILLGISVNGITQTRTRVTGSANWNTNSTWVKTLSGSVTCTVLGSTVTGSGTSFTTELQSGDVLTTLSGQEIGTVSTVSSNTSLTLTGNAQILLTLFTGFGVEKVPAATDDVEIGNSLVNGAVSVNLNTAASINSLTFIADNESHELTHSGSNSLVISNSVTINQPTVNGRRISWNIDAGNATVQDINFTGNAAADSRKGRLKLTSGSLTVNGNITFSGVSAASKELDMSGGAGIIHLKGTLTAPGGTCTFSAGTSGSIFNYAGTSTQVINFFPSGAYHNLYINNTHANGASLSANITASNVTGNIMVGNLSPSSLFKTANYAVALSSSGSMAVESGSVMDAGTSIISFGSSARTLTINGTFKTANVNGFTGAANSAINNGVSPVILLGAGSEIEYNSPLNQVVSARPDYARLIVSGGAVKTANGQIATSANLHIGNSTTFDAGPYEHLVGGTLTSNGVFLPNISTMNFSGTGAQSIPGLNYHTLKNQQ